MSPGRDRSPAWNEASWTRHTEQEVLIDLAEWADAAGCERLTRYRCAVTSGLWTVLESTPIARDGSGRKALMRGLVRVAERMLEPLSEGLPAPGVVADFAFRLPSRSAAASSRSLRVHAERSSDGALYVSIGLRADFDVHPLESAEGAKTGRSSVASIGGRGCVRPPSTAAQLVDVSSS